VVATSSLELGIDMGAIDLVVQVGAPPSVASGLQRVGRAGHQVGAVSRGVVFPTFRGDLVPAAVIAGRMRRGEIERLTARMNEVWVQRQGEALPDPGALQPAAILAQSGVSVGVDTSDAARIAQPSSSSTAGAWPSGWPAR